MSNDLYAVTPEEKEEYSKFSFSAMNQLLRRPPDVLWYYTSGSTFSRMLDSQSVWSTQISCLNDHSEFRYAARLLRRDFETRTEDGDEDVRWLVRHLVKTIGDDDGADWSWFYVFCMSDVRDDLSQWRAYAGGEGGVCIGLDPFKIMTPETFKRAYLVPVRYSAEDHRKVVNDVANWTCRFFKNGIIRRGVIDREKWAQRFLEAWREHVVYLAPILKDKAFEKEAEWRIVWSLTDDDLPRVQLQQRNALLSRHLPLKFGDRLPIKEVVVGPCRHPSVSKASVGTYLEAKGYKINRGVENDLEKVTVSSSSIPFQTM